MSRYARRGRRQSAPGADGRFDSSVDTMPTEVESSKTHNTPHESRTVLVPSGVVNACMDILKGALTDERRCFPVHADYGQAAVYASTHALQEPVSCEKVVIVRENVKPGYALNITAPSQPTTAQTLRHPANKRQIERAQRPDRARSLQWTPTSAISR